MTDAVPNMSATEMARCIHAKDISSLELTRAHLERIEAVNPSLNAVVRLSPKAIDDARKADRDLARGAVVGPLHGVPFTVKDWIETAGLECSAGFESRRNHRPTRDATVVARMRAAGAILLGKTKTGTMADIDPAPHNPHDPTRTPGGSSSGEAAIIAARGSPLGLGSDSGGSIRWPAHCCGIVGFKPTNGLVPSTGHFPRIVALSDPRTTIGPMARYVDDVALATALIAGVDSSDASVVPMPLADYRIVQLKVLRIAAFTQIAGARPSTAVVDAVDATARRLAEQGAIVEQARPPRVDESLDITRSYWARPESMSLLTWKPSRVSSLSADQVEESLFEWDRLKRAFTAFMADYDLIVCPAAADAAPARTEMNETDFIYTLPFSLTGQPSIVVPAGQSDEGLPIGVQIVARTWQDHVALAAARALE